MKVKNTSARLHCIGGVYIAPGAVGDVDDKFVDSIDSPELQVVADDYEEPVAAPVAPAKGSGKGKGAAQAAKAAVEPAVQAPAAWTPPAVQV